MVDKLTSSTSSTQIDGARGTAPVKKRWGGRFITALKRIFSRHEKVVRTTAVLSASKTTQPKPLPRMKPLPFNPLEKSNPRIATLTSQITDSLNLSRTDKAHAYAHFLRALEGMSEMKKIATAERFNDLLRKANSIVTQLPGARNTIFNTLKDVETEKGIHKFKETIGDVRQALKHQIAKALLEKMTLYPKQMHSKDHPVFALLQRITVSPATTQYLFGEEGQPSPDRVLEKYIVTYELLLNQADDIHVFNRASDLIEDISKQSKKAPEEIVKANELLRKSLEQLKSRQLTSAIHIVSLHYLRLAKTTSL